MIGKHSADAHLYIHMNREELFPLVKQLHKKLKADHRDDSYTICIGTNNDMDDPAQLELRVFNINDAAKDSPFLDTDPSYWKD